MDFEKKERETRFGETVKLKRDLREKRAAQFRERLRTSKWFERDEQAVVWRGCRLVTDLRKRGDLYEREYE